MNRSFTSIAIIITIGMMISAYFVSQLYLRIRNEEEVSVKGVAEQLLTADIGKLRFSVIETGQNPSDCLISVRKNYETLLTALEEDFGNQAEFFTHEPTTQRINKTVTINGKKTAEFSHYQAENACQVVSTNVYIIAAINRELTLNQIQNMKIEAGAPEYLLRDISQIKLRLLQEATANGWERAQALVSSKGSLGKLVSASQGVFQITEPYSTDSSWSGMYDKSTIEKNIKAVVTLEYAVK